MEDESVDSSSNRTNITKLEGKLNTIIALASISKRSARIEIDLGEVRLRGPMA